MENTKINKKIVDMLKLSSITVFYLLLIELFISLDARFLDSNWENLSSFDYIECSIVLFLFFLFSTYLLNVNTNKYLQLLISSFCYLVLVILYIVIPEYTLIIFLVCLLYQLITKKKIIYRNYIIFDFSSIYQILNLALGVSIYIFLLSISWVK